MMEQRTVYGKPCAKGFFDLTEKPSTAVSEAPFLKAVGEVRQEGSVHEAKHSETPSAVENANLEIVEHINNGLSLEQIDKRLDAELQQPEMQRQLIKEFSPYSEQLNPHFRTTQEVSVYTRTGLQEVKIRDYSCLQLKIDPNRCDAMGRSNMERTAAGRAAIDENGDPVNLHHIGQKENSPLAELPDRVHKEFDSVLHDKSISTEVHGDGSNWNVERAQYWKERSLTL
jgi:A nuclease of the HNH/ENDO VII superfamily with conserved LHH